MAEIRLLEDRLEKNRILVLSAKVYERADREYAAVYQYQPMPELLDQIGKYYLELLPESSGYCLSREMEQEVITVFGFGKEEIRNAYALDTAEIGALPSENAVAFLWNNRITITESREDMIDEWKASLASPVAAASLGEIDDIINMTELRARICSALFMLASKGTARDYRHAVRPF